MSALAQFAPEQLDAIADRTIKRMVEAVEADDPVAQRLAVALVNVGGLDNATWSKSGQRLEMAARAARESRLRLIDRNDRNFNIWWILILLAMVVAGWFLAEAVSR